MKLYDFHCNACGKDFEELVQEVADARCPACAKGDVQKQLSGFNVGRAGGSTKSPARCPASGGPCGGGGCGLN